MRIIDGLLVRVEIDVVVESDDNDGNPMKPTSLSSGPTGDKIIFVSINAAPSAHSISEPFTSFFGEL
jgi:hypothetical protein